MDLLDIVLHYDCNLHCSYCTLTPEMRAKEGVDRRAVAMEIERAARDGCKSVQFTGGEPTIRPDLLPLIRFAAGRGFTHIKVQTNGLAFASAANLERAAAAGMSEVAISIHGFHPDTDAYAQVTGSRDAQALMLQAVDNILAAGLVLSIDMIVMRSSLDALLPAMQALAARGASRFNLWFVSLTDANAAHPESMPRISEAVPAMTACMDYGRAQGLEVASLHVPRCLLPGYEEHVRHPAIGREIRVVTPESVFDLSQSRLSGGVLPEACQQCRYVEVCPGLRADYVEQFGVGELRPVR